MVGAINVSYAFLEKVSDSASDSKLVSVSSSSEMDSSFGKIPPPSRRILRDEGVPEKKLGLGLTRRMSENFIL
jgi:hypothetical protein